MTASAPARKGFHLVKRFEGDFLNREIYVGSIDVRGYFISPTLEFYARVPERGHEAAAIACAVMYHPLAQHGQVVGGPGIEPFRSSSLRSGSKKTLRSRSCSARPRLSRSARALPRNLDSRARSEVHRRRIIASAPRERTGASRPGGAASVDLSVFYCPLGREARSNGLDSWRRPLAPWLLRVDGHHGHTHGAAS